MLEIQFSNSIFMVKPPQLSQAVRVKILLIGPKGAGKSDFINFAAKNQTYKSAPTLGTDLVVLQRIYDKIIVKFNVFDLSGDSIYREVRQEFYKDQSAVIFCVDLSNPDSKLQLNDLVEECKSDISSSGKYLIGLKSDISKTNESELEILAQRLGARFFMCSAKTDYNVTETIDSVLQEIYKKYSGKR